MISIIIVITIVLIEVAWYNIQLNISKAILKHSGGLDSGIIIKVKAADRKRRW